MRFNDELYSNNYRMIDKMSVFAKMAFPASCYNSLWSPNIVNQ